MAASVGVDPLAEFGILCRLCGAKTSVLLGLHIFDREGNLREICKKIKACLPIQVTNDDKLPKMVCEECVYKLDELYEFREKSVKTEYFLTSMLKGLMATPRVSSQQYAVQRPSVQIGNLMCGTAIHSSEIQLRPQVEVHLTDHSIQLESIITSLPLSDANMVKNESEFDSLKNTPNDNLGPRSVETDTNDSIVTSVDVDHSQDNCTITEHIVNKIRVADIRSLQSMGGAGLKADVEGDRHFIVTATHSDHPWFFCDICGKPFGDSNEFQAHCEIHWKKCNACGVTCANDDALILHLREAHNEATSLQQVQISVQEPVQDSTMVTVQQSGADSSNLLPEKELALISEQMQEEQTVDTQPKIDAMDRSLVPANEETSSPNPKSNTEKTSLASYPKSCVECNKSFRTNYKLAEHMRKHTGEKPYKCSTCEKTFRSKIGLAQHEARHTGQYDFTCNTCGKGFQCKSYLIVHQRVHSDLKPFPCETCGRDFKTKQSLLDHQNRHLGVKPYQCDVCGRGFITKGLCKSHQKIHSGTDNRQFPCSVCSKLFVSKSYLATHMRIHTGEKPFMCEVCGKGFVTRVDLRIHSTMHTGEKSFVCEMCGKAFARRDALRCHKRSHTGERPYVCDICGQGFTQFTPMAIHKRLHTGERPYTCDMCDKTFVSKSTMMSHKKKHAWFQKPPDQNPLAAPETTQSFTEVFVVSNDSPTFANDTCSAPQLQ